MQMEVYVGTILPAAFNFAPIGWVPCDGRLLPISEYEVLYTLLGTTYGGNGVSTFGVPDLRGRIPIGYGQGPGQPNVVIGQAAGQMSTTLTSNNMPAHNHLLRCAGSSIVGTTNAPANGFPTNISDAGGTDLWAYTDDVSVVTASWNPVAVSAAGASLPIDTVPPYLVVNYMIATQGLYPSQG